MRLKYKRLFSRLERALSNILRGRSLEMWAEEETTKLIAQSGQKAPPVKLTGLLLEARKIKKIHFEPNLSTKGQLIVDKDGFVVSLAPTKKSASAWFRLCFAHEIAHTFLYDVSQVPPRSLTYMEPGNRDLEWLCDYLARCLTIPAKWVRKRIELYPQLGSNLFSLDVIFRLEHIFFMPWRIIAKRLVEDMNLWNCIILQFALTNEISAFSKDNQGVWRLLWYTLPHIGTDRLFIPVGRWVNGVKRTPGAKGVLKAFIKDSIHKNKETTFFQQVIPSKVLKSSTFGNLGKFLCETLNRQDVTAYCAVKKSPIRNIIELPSDNRIATYLLICIPFLCNNHVIS